MTPPMPQIPFEHLEISRALAYGQLLTPVIGDRGDEVRGRRTYPAFTAVL